MSNSSQFQDVHAPGNPTEGESERAFQTEACRSLQDEFRSGLLLSFLELHAVRRYRRRLVRTAALATLCFTTLGVGMSAYLVRWSKEPTLAAAQSSATAVKKDTVHDAVATKESTSAATDVHDLGKNLQAMRFEVLDDNELRTVLKEAKSSLYVVSIEGKLRVISVKGS